MRPPSLALALLAAAAPSSEFDIVAGDLHARISKLAKNDTRFHEAFQTDRINVS